MSTAKARHRRRYRRRATADRNWERRGGLQGFLDLVFPDDGACRRLNDISMMSLPAHTSLLLGVISGDLSPERAVELFWLEP